MTHELIIAGFGGQGVLFAGDVLIKAAFLFGKNVIWMPSYGPEMRGGTANCSVIVSKEEIGSPVVEHPDGLIALNGPSLAKFGSLVKGGGVIVTNKSLCASVPWTRTDVRLYAVEVDEIAEKELKTKKAANMVALGAFAAASGVCSLDELTKGLQAYLDDEGKLKLFALNKRALELGAKAVS